MGSEIKPAEVEGVMMVEEGTGLKKGGQPSGLMSQESGDLSPGVLFHWIGSQSKDVRQLLRPCFAPW